MPCAKAGLPTCDRAATVVPDWLRLGQSVDDAADGMHLRQRPVKVLVQLAERLLYKDTIIKEPWGK